MSDLEGTAPQKREERASPPPRWKKWVLVGIVVVALGGLYAASRVLPVQEKLQQVMEWIDGLGLWGYFVFAALYILACVLMVPGTILSLGAGVVFGPLWGTVAVSVSSTAGACAAFLIGRTFARNWVAKKVEGNEKFHAIDEAVGREGFKVVLLTRLSPVFPFNLLNYAYGLTGVSFLRYFIASWIGMLPGTIMYVYIGSVLGSFAAVGEKTERTTAEWVFYAVGLVVTVAVAVVVARVAKKAINQTAVARPDVR